MAIDATGTPTSLGIPKLNTATDAPSGKGINAMMDSIDALIAANPTKPSGTISGETVVFNGGGWDRSSVTKLGTASLSGYPWVNADIAAGAAISASKLAGYPADATKALMGDGTWKVPGGGITIYDRVTTATDINTTIAETTLYTKTIAANDLGTNKTLRLSMNLDVLYNNVAGNSCRIRVKFGATTVLDWTHNGVNGVIGATRELKPTEILLTNLGATNSQLLALTQKQTIGVGTTSSMGDFTFTTGVFAASRTTDSFLATNTAAEDTTANKDLVVTVQWGTSSANNSYRLRSALAELM